MPVRNIRAFLDAHGVRYVIVQHSPVFTAQEIAESVHVSGRHFAKSVLVKLDGVPALAVLPATRQIDLDALAEAAGADAVELADETELNGRFPECDPGAVPPFGNLFDLPVYLNSALAEQEELIFNAGRHTEVMRLSFEDFAALVEPRIADF